MVAGATVAVRGLSTCRPSRISKSVFVRPTRPRAAACAPTLEAAGVVFIAENGGGAGARLKFSRDEVWEVNRWEDEGGVTGEDDVL